MAAAANLWVMIEAIPDANQTHREITLQIVTDRAEGQVRAREFFTDFPDTVLYVHEIPPTGGWLDVLAADIKNAQQPIIYTARRGRMVVNREKKTIEMVLEDGARHTTRPTDPAIYETVRFDQLIVSLDPESVFPRTGLARGEREMTIAELQALIAELKGKNLPFHNPVMQIQKKFSIPMACFVFAFVGVGLGVSNRKDGRLASFVLGIAVIFVYYVVMFTSQSMTKGGLHPGDAGRCGCRTSCSASPASRSSCRARAASIGRCSSDSPRCPFRRGALACRPTRPHPREPARRAGGPVLVIRMPQFELPRPNLLDLYVSRAYVRMLIMCIVGLLGLFYISTFIDLSDKLFKGQVTLGTILSYLWWKTPQFLYYIIAIAVLLAAIVTIGALTRNSELIVMRACGISIYRTAVPLVVFAVAASAVLFAFEEQILAVANRRADYLRHIIRGGSPTTFDVVNRKWVVGREGEIYHYQYFDPRQARAQRSVGVPLRSRDACVDRAPLREPCRLCADGGGTEVVDGAGRAGSASSPVRTSRSIEPLANNAVALEPSDYFVTEAPEPDRMNFEQLRKYIVDLKASGYVVLEQEVALYRKFAFPLVTLIMTLIAVPFAVTVGKSGAMYGVGIGIVLALVYWTAISVFAAFGAGRRAASHARRVGPEPAVRRLGRVPPPHGPHVTAPSAGRRLRTSPDHRRRPRRGLRLHRGLRLRHADPHARSRRLRHPRDASGAVDPRQRRRRSRRRCRHDHLGYLEEVRE